VLQRPQQLSAAQNLHLKNVPEIAHISSVMTVASAFQRNGYVTVINTIVSVNWVSLWYNVRVTIVTYSSTKANYTNITTFTQHFHVPIIIMVLQSFYLQRSNYLYCYSN
jgi:hypothetical protein